MDGKVELSLDRYHELLRKENNYEQSYVKFEIENSGNTKEYFYKIGKTVNQRKLVKKLLSSIVKSLNWSDHFDSKVVWHKLNIVKKLKEERYEALDVLHKVYNTLKKNNYYESMVISKNGHPAEILCNNIFTMIENIRKEKLWSDSEVYRETMTPRHEQNYDSKGKFDQLEKMDVNEETENKSLWYKIKRRLHFGK